MDDVRKWLKDNGFERFADLFEDNEIDADALRELGEDHLKELGIPLGPRVKLLKAIAALNDDPQDKTQQRPLPLKAGHGAERRQLTVMFVDLVGSTALSGKLDPEEMRAVITSYQQKVSDEVARFGGHVAKFMGDGVLCYFGWPEAHEDDAERAVRTGLAIIQTIKTLSTPAGDPLATRVGIATGLVVVGDLIGEGAAQEEAVIGETPNLAARLQGLAGINQVVLDELTNKLAGHQFGYEDLGLAELKGIASPTQVWRVVGEAETQHSRFEASHTGVATPTVGRSHEAGLLLERWKLTKDGDGQVVLLSGEAGIGKSHLTQILRNSLSDEHHYRLRFQCSPHQINNSLYPAVRQIEYACGFKPDDDAETRLDKLGQHLSLTSQDDDRTQELFATLLGLDGKGRFGEFDLTAQQRQNQTFAALIDQLLALSRQRPVLLIFEDIHWVDPTTEQLLAETIAAIGNRPVMMVITYRPDYAPQWQAYPYFNTLSLNRLGRRQSADLIEALCHGQIPDTVINQIIERAGGVPLYVEELTKSVLETMATGESTAAADLIPETLQASLTARLDRLGKHKELAQLAAVVGREFDAGTLATAAQKSEPDMAEPLEALIRSGLIMRTGSTTQNAFRFKHALVRDTAYESLLKERRKSLHKQVGEAMEAVHMSDLVQHLPALAMHYREAGVPEMAIPYAIAAGDTASERNANVEARVHYDDALTMASAMAPSEQTSRFRIRATLKMARVAANREQFQADLENLEIAKRLAEEIDHQPRLCQTLYWLGRTHYVLGQHGRVTEYVEPALHIGEALQDDRLTAAPLNLLGRLKFFAEPKVAAELLSRSSAQMAALGDKIEQAGADGMLSVSYMLIGQFANAVKAANRSVELAERIEHLPSLAAATYYRGDIFGWMGDMERSVADFDRAQKLAANTGDVFRLYLIHGERGLPHLLDDDLETAGEHLFKCKELAEQIGTKFSLGRYQAVLAEVRLRQGYTDEAIELAREALEIATEGDQAWPHIVAARTVALTLIAGDPPDCDKAEAAVDTAIKLAEEREMLPELAWSLVVKAKVCAARGDAEGSGAAVQKAASLFEKMGLDRELKRVGSRACG